MRIYVDQSFIHSGNGTKNQPFQTISQAAQVAVAGDEILVAPGLYRESIDPVRGGNNENQRVIYRSIVRHGAIISGAEELRGWRPFQGDTYVIEIDAAIFGEYDPFETVIRGDWYYGKARLHTAELFINLHSMYEAQSLDHVLQPCGNCLSWEPTFTKYVWYAEKSGHSIRIYANFGGLDPEKECIEVSVRKNCFYPSRTGINYITVSGFVIRQAATQWAPPTAEQVGMLGPHWSKGWIIEDCEISHSRCVGISLGKYGQPQNENKWSNLFYKHGTQTEREAVCQAVNEGWNRENIGSHIIRKCEIHHCGQAGIIGHLGGVFSQIEDNHIHHINVKHDLEGAEIGGIKMHAAIDVVFKRNHIHHCTRGIWLDWQAQGARITQCLFHDNAPPEGVPAPGLHLGEDIFVEMSHGPTLIDHNFLLSPHACRLSTQGIAMVHNLVAGAFTYVGSGTENWTQKYPSPRYAPYHVPHSTKIAGFMTILHGDARFYNNIFIQAPIRKDLIQNEADSLHGENLLCGTKPYDGYPTAAKYFSGFTAESFLVDTDIYYAHMPVYTGGNLFCNGAQPCDCEQGAAILSDFIEFHTSAHEGRYILDTNLGDFLSAFPCKSVLAEKLGTAFEPEQPFESPDGSPASLLLDYKNKEHGKRTIPGPFADPADYLVPLK